MMIRSGIFITIFILVAGLSCFSQRKADWGISAGSTGYLGDLNHDNLFGAPGIGASVFYRYNFHPRHSLRTSLLAGTLSGDDRNAGNAFQTARGESFSGFVTEASSQFEFNFFPYLTTGRSLDYSPYIAAGLGVAFISTEVFTYTPVIPLTLGIKINLHKNYGLELEYGFRKTFYDNFDGSTDPVDPGHFAWTHNNDWYTYLAVSFTWKMYRRLAGCPAYEGERDYKRSR